MRFHIRFSETTCSQAPNNIVQSPANVLVLVILHRFKRKTVSDVIFANLAITGEPQNIEKLRRTIKIVIFSFYSILSCSILQL